MYTFLFLLESMQRKKRRVSNPNKWTYVLYQDLYPSRSKDFAKVLMGFFMVYQKQSACPNGKFLKSGHPVHEIGNRLRSSLTHSLAE